MFEDLFAECCEIELFKRTEISFSIGISRNKFICHVGKAKFVCCLFVRV